MTLLQRKRENNLGDKALIAGLVPGRSKVRPTLKRALILLAAVALIVVLARPQKLGGGTTTDVRKGIEVMLMVDVSNSMLATDITPSRIERSKLLVSTLVDRLENDKVGIGVFAGESYPLLPITNDYVSAKMFLDGVNTDMISLQGTDLSTAIATASKSFSDTKDIGKAIVIITDAENHEEGAVEAAKEAAKAGQHVYVLGVGSREGGPIPTANGPLCDNEGNVVITRVNAEMGQTIAEAGGGTYIQVDNSNLAQDQLQAELKQLKQKESAVADGSAINEQFQAMALIALLLLLLEFVVMEVKNPLFRNMNLFSKKAALLLLLLLSSTAHTFAQTPAYQKVKAGNKAFKQQDYYTAERLYREAQELEPRNSRITFNLADTYAAQDSIARAMEAYDQVIKNEPNKMIKAMAHHNKGYIHHLAKDYQKAIEEYKSALRLNPNDEDTRYNLALCQRQQQQQQQQEKKDQQQQKQDQQQQKQDKQQQDAQQQPQQQNPPQPQHNDNTEQLLKMAQQAENQTRKKLEKMQPRRKSLPKNW